MIVSDIVTNDSLHFQVYCVDIKSFKKKQHYLLCICNTHDVKFGWEWERERKLFVIPAMLQCLKRVTERTLSNAKRSISD